MHTQSVQTAKPAEFVSRDRCLGCGSQVREIASGSFDDEPLRGFIANDPWGESPLPHLRGARWEYVGCVSCGLAFHRRILSPKWNAIRFERWMTAEAIAEFERLHTTAQSRFERGTHFTKHALQIEAATRRLRGTDPVRVLDFGCGNGQFIQQCAIYGFHAAGVDRSTARQGKNLTPIYADLSALHGQKFHAITLFEVLEHLDDPRSSLESLASHLVPGGVLVIETPDCTGVAGIRNAHEHLMINPLDHINGFTPGTMRSFASRLGFEPIYSPTSHVTSDAKRAIKTEMKRLLRFAARPRTQQYFRKAGSNLCEAEGGAKMPTNR
jgi:SAM-dependent methyltransferase